MSERGWAAVAGCLAVACGLTAWAWIGERETHRVTRIELAKAAARLSAQVPTAPAASPRAAALPAPYPDDSSEIEDLSERLAAAELKREEYREGLEQAVAELNRQKGKHQAELVAARASGGAAWPAPPATSATRPRGKVVPLLDPELTPLGDQILVTGRVYNVGDSDTEVTCSLELLRDGQRIDSARFLVRVSAGATQPYSHKFPFRGGIQGSYSARLSIE